MLISDSFSLKDSHLKSCFAFVNEHTWVNILWSEGFKIKTFGARDLFEDVEMCFFNPKTTVSITKHGRMSIMFCGCFFVKRTGSLVNVNSIVKQKKERRELS